MVSLVGVKDNEITIKPKSTKTVKAKLKIPDKFNGVLYGGFFFQEVEKDEKTPAEGFVMKTAFTIPLKITVGKEPKADIKLKTVIPDNEFHEVNIYFQNASSALLNNVNYKLNITRLSDGKVVAEKEMNDLNIAPNSNFNLGVAIPKDDYTYGKYEIKIEGQELAKDSSVVQNLEFDHKFEIVEPKKVQTYTPEIVEQRKGIDWVMVAFLIVIIILLSLIILVVIARIKRKMRQKKHFTGK
jgi:hypothetical protein